MTGPSVAVVGGGITGLAAAWELVQAGTQVTLYEAGPRLGGRILTADVAGRAVDLGPDALLARVPHAVELCRELGLEDELVHPAAEGASIWSGGRLRALPRGLVMGAPLGAGDLFGLARSGLLSPAGAARAALDLVRPATRWGPDPSVHDLVAGRLGPEVHRRLVDPLVGGIHAGPSALLSARSTAPQLAEAAAASRSLILGLRKGGPAGGRGRPVFVSLRGGLGRLVGRLEERLHAGGAAVLTGTPAEAVPVPGAAATVLAVPASGAARLLAPVSPEAAAELDAVDYASVALAVLVYPAEAVRRPLVGTGFLVPAGEGRLVTACSFGSAKWPHWAAPGDVVVRVSAGRWGDERALGLDDDGLVARLTHDLGEMAGIAGDPKVAVVTRWERAFPQYRPGHAERVARVEQALARDLPTVYAAGAAYRGVGIAACVAQGRAAARRAVAAAAAGGRSRGAPR